MPPRRVVDFFLSPLRALPLLLLLVWLLSYGLAGRELLGSVELIAYDLLFYLRGPQPPPEDVVVVDFDEASLNEIDQWPIPRRYFAQVIRHLAGDGADLIGLDYLVDKERPREAADDAELARAIAEAGNVVLAEGIEAPGQPAARPRPMFADAAFAIGVVNLPHDSDGLIRRAFLLGVNVGGQPHERLTFVLAEEHRKARFQKISEHRYELAGRIVATDPGAFPSQFLINYFGPASTVRTFAARDILAGRVPAGTFRNRVVIVGQSHSFGRDVFQTPYFRFPPRGQSPRQTPGAEIQATVTATLLAGRTIAPVERRRVLGLCLALAGLALVALVFLRPWLGVPSVIVLAGGVWGLAVWAFVRHNVWMPYAGTEASLALTLPVGLGYRFLVERELKRRSQAERAQLMDLFGRYVSPEVAQEIWAHKDSIVLGGQELTATVLFSDIRSFTSITAGQPSTYVVSWLNEYFDRMNQVVKRHRGFLNKFIGDGLMVLFGVPVSQGVEEDALNAVATAVEMHKELKRLNEYWRTNGGPDIDIGVGIHTGLLTAGTIGSRDRMEYSAIGASVNLTARLEAATRKYDCKIVVSEPTWQLVKEHYATRFLGEADLKGFSETFPVYAVEVGGGQDEKAHD